ncbi:hypothetical protein D2E25_0784 [Bifidobacterium goeldii]|uniref:Uncharacterized protein n=1 Tax=Bifidobacterium goeldii TaxID=2306975 RepID=A0A430FL48_9BIFI|nr:hypothetical protein [Bifidobacterium goeldii]RSX53461.1 hypothetical protein D2E25_0784 [Bifidobacterium goeldii]
MDGKTTKRRNGECFHDLVNRMRGDARGNDTGGEVTRGKRPAWWYLLAAFLVFALFVTGAFAWQTSTMVTAQKCYDELVSLDPNITVDELKAKGYIYNGRAESGWAGVDDRDYPWYVLRKPSAQINKFISDVRANRESVLRLYTIDEDNEIAVRLLWYDPTVEDSWVSGWTNSSVTVKLDGNGQIRQWWWKHGGMTDPDKRFSRDIEQQSDGDRTTIVLHNRPKQYTDGSATMTVHPLAADEVLYSY